MKRSLAVVLYADVVGYSHLTGIDEQATLENLSEYLHRFTELIRSHNGVKIKEAGDAILAEFSSAIDAVECAIQFQRGMATANSGKAGDDRFEFRVGINLGEIIHDRNDIFGDGVNIAARIQDSAEPGAISVASSVHELVKGKVDITFHDQGFRNFKNIEDPVQVFSIAFSDLDPDSSDENHPANFLNSRVKNQPLFDFDGSTVSKEVFYTGGCLCGEVRFEIYEQETGTGVCHCRICQKALGAVMNAWAAFSMDAVKFTSGEPKFYDTSQVAERGFCSNCGTSLTYRLLKPEKSDFLVMCIPAFDHPEKLTPAWHGGVESSYPWLKLQDDLPRVRSKESPSLQRAWASVGRADPDNWKPNTKN